MKARVFLIRNETKEDDKREPMGIKSISKAPLINKAEKKINNSSTKKKKGENKDAKKRIWLENVDYKNGGLLSDKKKTTKKLRTSTEEGSESSEKTKKKSKFLTKFHREQHDNIFSKKFKQNKLENSSKKIKRKH